METSPQNKVTSGCVISLITWICASVVILLPFESEWYSTLKGVVFVLFILAGHFPFVLWLDSRRKSKLKEREKE
jgi:hypothetical protein